MNPFADLTKSETHFYERKYNCKAFQFENANTAEEILDVAINISNLARQFLPVMDAENQIKVAKLNAMDRARALGVRI